MTGVTYGDLIAGATTHLTAGITQVTHQQFDSKSHARAVLADYLGLLDAIESHTYALVTPARLVAGAPHATSDQVVNEAVAMVDGLREDPDAVRPHPSVIDRADRPWLHAARHLRAASDLVAVHTGDWGRPLSPDAPHVHDPTARSSALVGLARQLDAALAAQTMLGLKSIHAGLSTTEVTRALPDLSANHVHAHALATHEPGVPGGLDSLRLIGEPARTHDPVLHAADLVHLLRQKAWALSANPDYSVRTLADLATAGVIIHAHAAAAHGANLTTRPAELTAAAGPLAARAAAWRDVRTDLAAYLAPGLPDPDVRAAERTLRTLLPGLAPLDGTPPADTRTPDILRTAAGAFDQVAADVRQAFRTLARSGQIHTNAHRLTGDQLADDPDLIAAKLSSSTVVAPEARWADTLELLERASAPAFPATDRPAFGAPRVESLSAPVAEMASLVRAPR